MSKLSLTTFMTLDGVMQGPGTPSEDVSGGFSHGGWLVPYADADMIQFMGQVFARADAFLLGRVTYQLFAAHWPRITDVNDPIATALNRLPKHVATRTLERLEWHNSSSVREVVSEVERLKRRYERELQVHGSAGLAQTLIEHDLVDEFHLLIYPILLGSGKRLFGAGTVPAALELVDSRTTGAGVAIHSYRRAGKPKYGSFALDG